MTGVFPQLVDAMVAVFPQVAKAQEFRMQAESVRLDLELRPTAAAIYAVQRAVTDLSSGLMRPSESPLDEDVVWRLGMVTHELLDNARKYGIDRLTRFQLEVDAAGGSSTVVLRVNSRGSTKHIEELRKIAADIRTASDAWAYYLAALRDAGERVDGSGVGLARIWAEGESTIDVVTDDGGNVTIGARLPLEARDER